MMDDREAISDLIFDCLPKVRKFCFWLYNPQEGTSKQENLQVGKEEEEKNSEGKGKPKKSLHQKLKTSSSANQTPMEKQW